MYKEKKNKPKKTKKKKKQGQCPVGHQTKPGPNPILFRLQQLAVVCSTEKNLSISVSSMPQPNSLLLRSS